MTDPKQRLSYVFFGLLLTILDIKINDFDILPDFFGYWCVFVGCSGLLVHSKQFLTAKNTAFILVVVSITAYFISIDFSNVYGFIYLALDVAMIWFILGALMDISRRESRAAIFRRASNLRIAYLIVMCLVSSSASVLRFSPNMMAPYSIALVLCTILVMFSILRLIHVSKHELAFAHD